MPSFLLYGAAATEEKREGIKRVPLSLRGGQNPLKASGFNPEKRKHRGRGNSSIRRQEKEEVLPSLMESTAGWGTG